jgi:GntR family histidine utilization transcriptional repressor
MSQASLDRVTLDGVGPVYDQIRRAIRDLVVGGEWPPGTSVPSEHALMERLGASRMTVHRALVQLAREGLIVRRRRSGTVVANPPDSHAILDIPSIATEVAAAGRQYSYAILSRTAGRPAPDLASLFALKRSEPVLHLTTLHRASGTPHVLEDRVIFLKGAPDAETETFAHLPPGDWLLRHCPWSRAEHAISAIGANVEEAAALGVAVGEPCLLVERRTWNHDAPVTAVRLVYPGHRHRFVGRFGPYGRL